jgi:hypothetical protein
MTVTAVTALQRGNIIQPLFSAGVRNLLSQDFREFEQVRKLSVSKSQARSINFMLLTATAPGSINYASVGTSGRQFGAGYQPTTGEYTAYLKQIEATLIMDYDVLDRALTTPEKYGEPLEIEVDAKARDARRRIAGDYYGDGTGVLGTASSAADTYINTSAKYWVVVTLNVGDTARGHVGMFEYGDLLLCKQSDGSARTPTGGSGFATFKVVDRSRKAGTVTLQCVQSDGATVATGYTASGIVAGDLFYKAGQTTFPNLSSTVSADYGTLTEVYAGLESLAASDGRLVHGITMQGSAGGSQLDALGAPLDANLIQEALDAVKVKVGQGAFKWKKMCMSPENHAKLINGRETDRRFQSVEDNKRGVRYWAYQHGDDVVEAYTSEFVHPQRIWGLPETKAGEKVLEYYGTDFKAVKAPGQSNEWMLYPHASGSYANLLTQFMISRFCIIAKMPPAIFSIRNWAA